jgi:tryptophan-rich sensory protein
MTTIDNKSAKQWRWYHVAMFYVGIQALSFALGKIAQRNGGQNNPKLGESIIGNIDNNAFYNRLKQPIFAPPDWVFAPVWTINNALCLWGLLRVLNMPKGTPGRDSFLALQAAVWFCFATFNAVYFGLRSPINGAISTKLGLVGTIASMYVAVRKLKDTRTALSQSTILPWLILASATATTVAAWNNDDFYNTAPFVEAAPGWVKKVSE